MTTNLNQYPYYDDYDEKKDFHQIMFKPSIPVQARELTQIQSILQNQISRFGDHIFNNGSRVTGAKLSFNKGVYSLGVTSTTLTGLSIGNYIKGQTSGMVAEIVELIENKNNKSFIIYVPRGSGANGMLFSSAETITAYVDGTMASQLNVSFTTETDTTFEIVASGEKGSNKITVASLQTLRVGSYVPVLDSYVIEINTQALTLTLSKTLPNDLVTNVLSVSNQASNPTMLIGVSDGVFYTGGRFARVGQQQIVPDVYNRWITKYIGLVVSEEFTTSDEDQTLLDPSQGSFNYMAPGADRLKVSLSLIAYGDSDTKDISFIELFRFESGELIRQNESSDYSTIMKTLAERTYDESGNYVVSPFLIRLLDQGDPNTIIASISPGKAYVGGYEFETISTTKLPLDRARDTEKATSFGINTYVGTHLEINGISGALPQSGSTVTFKSSNGNTVGTAIFLNLAPLANGNTRLYVTEINGAIAPATTVSIGTMTATIMVSATDIQNNSLVYSAPQTYVKGVEKINYTTSRMYRNVPFTNGFATISALNINERFVGGTGILPSGVASDFYQVFNASGHTMNQVEVKPYVPGTLAQVVVGVDASNYNGYGDIVLMVEVNDDTGRTKTLNQYGVLINNLSTTYQSLKRADLHELQYVSILNDDDVYSGKWTAIAHPMKTVVYHNGVLYRSLVSNTTTDAPSDTNVEWEALSDMSNLVSIDTGQRNTYYDHAYVKFTTASAITSANNRIVVVFDYFSHSGVGPITVNSYPLAYTSIPTFTGSNGLEYDLKNCLDYRARRADDSTTLTFDSIQFSDDAGTEVDITYYLSRIDKIVITTDRQFKVLKGISSYYAPRPPSDLPNAMTIAMIVFSPYTDDLSKINLKMINNRRYTMKDIGLLDTRITNVEKYTNLNSLENKVLNKTYYGTTGLELFKSGFLTDGFETYINGNTRSPEYRCSIDTIEGVARPMFSMDSVQLIMDTALSTSRKTTTLVTAPYTEKIVISNRVATGTINVNPFNVVTDIGQVVLSPSSDYWFDTKSLPIIYATSDNSAAFVEAQKQAANFNANAQWSAWNVVWGGFTSTVESTRSGGIVIGPTPPDRVITFLGTETLQRTKLKATVGETSAIVSDNTVTVSKEIQPYARAKDINFEIFGLTPNIRVYGWIDDVSVDEYITPNTTRTDTVVGINVTNGGTGYSIDDTVVTITGGTYDATAEVTKIENGVIKEIRVTFVGSGYSSDPVVTITGSGSGAVATGSRTVANKGTPIVLNNKGYASGVLKFPNDENVKFPCGKRHIVFGDTPVKESTNSFADAIYTTEGYINTNQRTITSTKVPRIITTVGEMQQTTREISVERVLPWNDPLAQSFLVDQAVNPHGIFATGFNFYFATKDPVVPVSAEIRPIVNGYPSSTEVIPSTLVVMDPDDVLTSTDATVPTKFAFTDPVFLPAGEYAVILMSGSNKYTIFISEMNKVQIGTNTAVSKQPYLGSLFESQNASTWTAEQMKDMCFDMFACEFQIGTSNLILKSEANDSNVNIDMFNLMAQNLQPELTTLSAVVQLPNGYSANVAISGDVELDAMNTIKNFGDSTVTISLTTSNKDVSPVIDLERTALICVHNIINNKPDAIIQETDNREGGALAKYVMKTVTLNEGFSASSVCVQLSVNRPAGSSIEVFARMRNEYDVEPLDQKDWILLNQEVNGGFTSTANDFVEDMWSIYDYTYNGFIDFNQFEVKVVFWSPSSANVPTLDDVRAVALA